jgi:hypothetical protein
VRLRAGEALAAAGALGLLLATFLTWYEGPEGTSLDAWQAFSVTDLILALLIALALALAVLAVTQRAPALPVAAGVVTAAASIACALLVLYRIVNQPGPNDALDVRPGAWLGLLALLVVAAGAWAAIADEGPRGGEPPGHEIERRPAPPRAQAPA